MSFRSNSGVPDSNRVHSYRIGVSRPITAGRLVADLHHKLTVLRPVQAVQQPIGQFVAGRSWKRYFLFRTLQVNSILVVKPTCKNNSLIFTFSKNFLPYYNILSQNFLYVSGWLYLSNHVCQECLPTYLALWIRVLFVRVNGRVFGDVFKYAIF